VATRYSTNAVLEVQGILAGSPPGYSFRCAGENEERAEAAEFLLTVFLVALATCIDVPRDRDEKNHREALIRAGKLASPGDPAGVDHAPEHGAASPPSVRWFWCR